MRKLFVLLLVLFVSGAFALTADPGLAQGNSTISTTVIDAGVFVTVKETVAGDVLSLYRIRGDRIILVDTVVNTGTRSDRDLKISDRYLHRLNVENR